MKIVRRGALPVGGDSGLLEVRDRALRRGFGDRSARRGEVREEDVWPGFVEQGALVRRRRARCGRCASCRRGERDGRARCCRRCSSGCRSTPCAATSSPTARSRTTSRTRCCPENREFIVAKTLEEGADLGVAFDGDADRCFFVDDTGEFVPGDFVTALLAESMLEKEPGAKVIYDVRASWAVPRDDRGGRRRCRSSTASATPSSSTACARRTRSSRGEVSAHYYFRDFSQADSGVVPFLLMLELISKRGREAVGDPRAVPRALLPHRRDQHAGRRRRR